MRFRTPFNGYSVKFSPFNEGRLAIATAQNFGIIGNGKLHVVEVTPGGLVETAMFDTADGVYDTCWSEQHENVLLAAGGDGTVKVYDLGLPPNANPLRSFKAHKHECCSVSWNLVQRDLFLSSSWDDSIHLWQFGQPAPLTSFLGHTYCVYQVAWNPAQSDVFLSASGDTTCRIWDTRQPQPTLVMQAHNLEVLTGDWCKYNPMILATGSIDKSIKVWDIRNPQVPVTQLMGHTYAVRRVMFSPHSETVLASCSYDMTVRMWDFAAPQDALIRVWGHHTEFAVGLDWSMLQEGLLASTGWDEWTCLWHQNEPGP